MFHLFRKITNAQESIVSLDVPILKERLRSGSLGATEVLEAFIAKTVQVNKDTNAIVEFIDEALERARALDKVPKEKRGPLHGIPISLKVKTIFKKNSFSFIFFISGAHLLGRL